ncbi:LOW QUALITY PROTEIN: uncharacterized protein LOC111049654 [Nilaparvata lugens]|uniref:LOW QUALITY PROTEIN: uncharacterized protein LOC111049654 n=1 Tax=Nilaparvata lugens TaxID=108931 RepID=UPI00193CE248|nr:LOW QUALITY PROTEIN: uncharacterized protein LOC111049654 [Nilaparvata lugens]
MDPYRLRRIGDVTIERVPTKAGDQQSADGDQLTSAGGSDQPPPISADDDNHDSAPAPKLHQPYKMKGKPHRSDNSEDEEEEEEEEEFSDEFESEEEDKVKSGNQYKDWRLGSAVSIDTVPKSGSGFKSKPSKPSRSKVVPRPIVSQPEAFQPEVPDKSVYNLGSAISLETINSRSNDDSNSRREFKPYREDFVSGNPGFDNKGLEPTSSYHSQPERKSEDNYQVPDRSSNFRENQDRSSTSFRENPTSRDGSKQPSDVPYHVTGSSEFNSYKQGDQSAPQYHRENVRLHQDNESLAQSRDGMSEQRKLSPQDVTDFKSFKLGSSVRLEPVGGGSFDQSRNFSGSYGSGLQQTSPSAMGQYSLSSNNSSEAKMLTDLDAASDLGAELQEFLRDEEFKLGSSVSLNPVKSNDGLDSYKSGFPVKSNDGLDSYKSGFPVKSNDGLDSYKSGYPVKSNESLDSFKSGFRLGSGVSLDIVKPKQEVDEYKMEEGEEEYEEEEEDETIAARIANSIAGDRQRETPAPVEEEEVKRKRGDEEVTSDEEEEEEESYGQFGKEQASNVNAQEPMQQEPSGEAEGEEAEERGDERREEEEEEEDKVADENAGEEEEEEEEDALNLLGKIKMEVDSDSEMVKIKEEPEEEEEGGGEDEEEGEEKKSGKRKSADSDEEGDDADKDNENKKKKKTDGSGSDSDSDKKERGPDGKKNANFRRNIREVMDESQLDQATLNAQRQEMERLRRVQEQHRIIREVQKQIQMNKQNSKTETRVISLLQGNTSLVKASPTPAASAASSSSQNTVVVKLSSGSGAPQIVNKKVLEMLRSQKPEPASKTAATSSKVTSQLTRSLLNKPHMMTPSVSIAPVKPPASATPDSPPTAAGGAAKVAAPGGGNDMAAIRKVTGKAKGKDVVTISSSSSSDEDDCILISEEEDGDEEGPEEEEDPTNSGMHTNDTYNVPDDQGRVLINVGHPDDEPDVFLAPQIARIIKPHQIGGVRFLFDNLVESLERFKTSSGFGCILAHSMGLGKTLQVVSFCDVFLRHTEARTVLCIMPINTLQNWLAEFNMWLPTDPSNSPLSAHGEVRPRNFPIYVLNDLQKTITARAKVVAEWSKEGGVLLIGYELYRQLSLKRPRKVRRGRKKVDPDEELDDKNKPLLEEMHTALVKPGPDLIICDEGHRIKNSHASISQALKQIRSKRRVVLTGYPLQNNLLEYWCMVDFVRPNYLGTKTEFSNMFERPIQNGQCIDSTPQDIRLMRYRAHVLHSLLEGFVQRRSHSVLTNTLPQKEEYVLLIRMTPFQRKLYDTFMNEVVRTKAVPNPLKAFAVCCKIWNHPDVLYHFLKKRANTGEAVDLDLEETAPPLIPPSMPGGMLPPLPGSGILLPGAQPIMPPGAALKPAPAKRGRGRSPKNPNAPKRERKKPASKTPAVAAVMPNAAVASTDNPDNKNQGLPMNNQGNSGPMNHPPGDVSGANPPYNQSYNNPNQFNQYQNQSQPSYPNMGGDQPNNYNQGNYGSQPPPNEFQNQFQPNYSNQNNSFNSSDNFYQGYGNYYPQNPQDGNSSNYNTLGIGGTIRTTTTPVTTRVISLRVDSLMRLGQVDNSSGIRIISISSPRTVVIIRGLGVVAGVKVLQEVIRANATATSGALSQDQSSNSYSDLQKMEQMGQQRTQGNSMQQGGLYGSVQNDGGQGHAPQGAQSNSNFMGGSQMPPPGSNHPMQGSQHQNTTTNQSLMQLGNPMMSGGHPPPGMHGLGNHMSSMMGGGQSDGSSTHMLQPLGSGNSFGSMGNDQSGGMGGLHHMSGNDPQGNMMGGIHNQGLMNNQPNQNILEGGNNDLIPPPNLQQNNRQHPMMAGRPGPGGGLPGGGQNKIPPPQPINQSGNMSHQQQPPPYDNQSYMGNMHMPNQGIPGTLGNPSMSSNQGMMMHGINHPGLSNQMDPNFHKPHDEGGMYRSPYPMSSYHPPSQPDPHQMGPMSGYRPQSTHQQSQHDKLIDDLFNNPSSDLGAGGQDTSNQDRGGILGMSPIKNTGNNMSGGMVNIQPKPVNQSQQYQPFNPPYNDPPQHGYDSSQNPSGFNQSDLMGNYQNASSSGSSGQNYQSSTAVGGSSGQNYQSSTSVGGSSGQNYQSSTGSSGSSYQSSTGGSGPNYQSSTSVGGSSGQSYQSSSTSVGGSSSQNYQSSTSVGGSSGQSYQSSTAGSGQNYQSPSTSVGGSSGSSYQSSTSGSSGQTYPMSGTNNERANHYHDQQQPSMMNNYQNLPQQFDNSGSGANFGGAQSQSYDGSLQNTAGNYGQQSSYMSSMFGGETANSGTGLNEGFGASVKEDKGFEDGDKDEKKGFEKKTWSGDGVTKKEVEEEKCETKTEKVVDGEEEDDEEKEMKSCGNQTEEKAGEGKTETTMVKDTSFSFGEMKEVGGTKDAATGEDDKQEGKGEGATNPPTPLVKSGKEDPGIPYDWAERLLKGYMPGDIEASAKMAILFCILEESINLGDRILVFSQSLFTLNLIEDFLQKTNLPNRAERWARNWNYYRLDGSTSALEREKLINEFNSNPNIHLFLVSTRAGSLGINLVGANRVIVFDASWNPCHDTQAVCRVYRYGQKKPCFVYRLVMDHCLEKKIYDRQINKQGMSDRVVDECNPDAHLSIKEVTNLCWDSEETEQAPMPDVATLKDKYIDVVMQRVLDRHGQTLSKEPFQHESLLVDRKDKKLSQAEKRLAKRSYELEKQASINSRPVYGYSGAGNQQGLQIRAIRGEGGGVVNKPMASVRPMQSESAPRWCGAGGAGGDRPRSWIPAEVWQKQGMSAQEMTLPLDVVIPTNSPDRSSIVLKAGQKVMVLKSPKGIYMQLENGKIIAIRTAIKVGNKGDKKTDKREFTFEGKKEVAVQPNRSRVQNLPIMRNNISIIPRGSGGSTGITSRAGGAGGAGGANRPLARMLGQNSNRPWGTPKQPIATTKPYFGETPPVTVTVTKKKVDAPASSTVRGQAKVERNPSTDESKDKDKGSDDNTDDKDKQPQRSASASSGASEASQRQDSASVENSAKRKVSSEQERLRSTEEELLHDVDDDDYDDEDDDDDDDEDDEEELDNHHMQQQRQASHRMRSMAASRQMSQQRMSAASQQAAAKKSSFTSGAGNRSGSPSVATSTASSSAAGNKMAPNAGQQSTSSMGGSHSTTTNVASQGAATSSSNATTTSSVTSHSSTSSAASSPHTTTSSSSVGASHATTTSMGLAATSGMSHSTTSNMGSSTTSNMGSSTTSNMGHSSSSNMGSSTTSNVGSSMTSNMGSSMTSTMGSSTTSNMGHSTSSIMGSHATTTSTSSHASSMAGSIGTTSSSMGSAPSAALGTAPAEKESRHPQMVPHQQQMSNPLSLRSDQQQHPVSNPSALRSDDYMHSRYSSPGASPVMSRSGQSEVGSHPSMSRSGQLELGSHPSMSRSGQSEVGSHPPMSRSGQSEVGSHPSMSRSGQSEVGSHPSMSRSGQSEAGSHPPLPKHLGSSVTVSPVASSAPSPSVPINSPNTSRPSSAVSINPPPVGFNPAVSMTPVAANPPPTYHHTPGLTSTGRRYTSTEYTADALSKSSEPTSSYHPALSHLKTISDHSISIFPVDNSKPSSTITSAQYGSAPDYNYRQDFRQTPAPRDYYQGFTGYPSSSATGYYPSSTVTSATVQRKDVKDTPYAGSYDQTYLPPNPFTAAAVGSGYSRSSTYHPQTTPPPSQQPSTTSSGATSDFSRMYSAFHRPEPTSFQPPSRGGVPAVAPPTHQFPPASPYNPYNPYLMNPHPYPHLPPQPPPQ